MPTLAQQTDASVKIASVVPGFSQTMAFWTMNGFSIEEADRILRQIEDVKTKEASDRLIENIFGGSQTQEPDEPTEQEVIDDGGAA
jgi:hypothetical protein